MNKFDLNDDAEPITQNVCSVPYELAEKALEGDKQAQKVISVSKARELLAERDFVYRASEGQLT